MIREETRSSRLEWHASIAPTRAHLCLWLLNMMRSFPRYIDCNEDDYKQSHSHRQILRLRESCLSNMIEFNDLLFAQIFSKYWMRDSILFFSVLYTVGYRRRISFIRWTSYTNDEWANKQTICNISFVFRVDWSNSDFIKYHLIN